MFRSACTLGLLSALCLPPVPGMAGKPAALQAVAMPEADRLRIAEAFRLDDALGNRVRPDWDKAPFAVLLVTPEHEFLVRHPKPTEDFALVGEDVALRGKVWVRK